MDAYSWRIVSLQKAYAVQSQKAVLNLGKWLGLLEK